MQSGCHVRLTPPGVKYAPIGRSRLRLCGSKKEPSSPSDKEKDYLYQLGQSDLNLNIDTGQNLEHVDSLFAGDFLGKKSDIADGSLRTYEFRSFSHLVGSYYVAPRFMERIALHIAKNYLADNFLSKIKIPLILGIWGPKGLDKFFGAYWGTGKSFMTELTFKKMGLEPIIMSAGELEHEWAGTPGKLIRERYRRASEVARVRGTLSCLLINDIDAGIGRFGNTQVTVNNQIVVGTLMNLCDDPTRASVGQEWRENDILRRVPIVVTGNDFSTLFAPLIRDGRMEKFYWEPRNEELVEIVYQMYKEDNMSRDDVDKLRKAFPRKPLDFFGAIRAATYDSQIRSWINETVGINLTDEEADFAPLVSKLLDKTDLPDLAPKNLTVDRLISEGNRLAEQQRLVDEIRLSDQYIKKMKGNQGSLIGFG